MPPYELSLIIRPLATEALVAVMERNLTTLKNKGVIITKLINLGERKLPYRMKTAGEAYWKARYFLVDMHAPVKPLPEIMDIFDRDSDILRVNMLRKEDEERRPCDTGECFWGDMDPKAHQLIFKKPLFKKKD